MDMRTDLTAVPHAGLGFHFLRIAGTLDGQLQYPILLPSFVRPGQQQDAWSPCLKQNENENKSKESL